MNESGLIMYMVLLIHKNISNVPIKFFDFLLEHP